MSLNQSQIPCAVRAPVRFYPQGKRLALHAHGSEAQLLFAAYGIMQVKTPSGRWLVPPARAVWLPPGVEHAVEMLTDAEMRSLYFDKNWLSKHAQELGLEREFVVQVRPLLHEAILTLCKATDNTTIDRQRRELLTRVILLELPQADDPLTFIPMPLDPRARKVAELVLSVPADKRNLQTLAHDAGTSARTLTRLFSTETKLSFKKWRQRARIHAAAEALGRGAPSIKKLSEKFGFSSVAAFNHAFRQVLGTTPTEFAHNHKAKREKSAS